MNPANAFPNAPPRYFDNGSGAKFLQPANQAPYTAVDNPPTQAQMTAVRDALISAGIMAAS